MGLNSQTNGEFNRLASGPHLTIGVVHFTLPVEGKRRGGVDRVVHDLSNGLARRGHRVTVWSIDSKPKDALYQVKRLPGKRLFNHRLGAFFLSGYLGNVAALIPDYSEADLLIAHGDSLLLPLKRIPLIRVMHGSALAEAFWSGSVVRFFHQMGVYALEMASAALHGHCVGVSRNTARYNPFVRRVILNGADLSKMEADEGRKNPGPAILFVGALQGRKRGRFLLDRFAAEIRAAVPETRLWMVSETGPSMEGVCYFENIGREQLTSLYRRAWVFASPSRYEGFGLPYVEAMAAGTPVVATPNPGSREILEGGRFGVLARDDQLAASIIDMLLDKDRRARYSELGRLRARDFDVESMVDRYEALCLEVVGRRPVGGQG